MSFCDSLILMRKSKKSVYNHYLINISKDINDQKLDSQRHFCLMQLKHIYIILINIRDKIIIE